AEAAGRAENLSHIAYLHPAAAWVGPWPETRRGTPRQLHRVTRQHPGRAILTGKENTHTPDNLTNESVAPGRRRRESRTATGKQKDTGGDPGVFRSPVSTPYARPINGSRADTGRPPVERSGRSVGLPVPPGVDAPVIQLDGPVTPGRAEREGPVTVNVAPDR